MVTQVKLVAIKCTIGTTEAISFCYEKKRKKGRKWSIEERFHPRNVRDAFRTNFEKVEKSCPGSIAKTAKLEDEAYRNIAGRKRRYVAESPNLVHPHNPKLIKQGHTEPIGGYFVDTNKRWDDIPKVLKQLCQAAGISFKRS